MIVGLRGTVRRVEQAAVVMRVGSFDLRVAMPTTSALAMAEGQEVEVYTHLYVREDQLALFGFGTSDELEIFEQLLSVSGVGPKLALGVLTALTPHAIRRAVIENNPHALTQAPGIGTRAASRIVTDLQGKVGEAAPSDGIFPGSPGAVETAIDALISMGYSPQDARRVIGSAGGGTVEQMLREALARLAER